MFGIKANYFYGAKAIGSTWSPKRQRLMVGRDIAPIQQAAPKKQTDGVTLSDSAELFDKLSTDFLSALSKARFNNSLQLGGLSEDKAQVLLNSTATEALYLDYSGSALRLRIDSLASGESSFVDIDPQKDMRISRGADGGLDIVSGSGALAQGKLVSKGADEILIRNSDVDVQAGEGTVVVNLAKNAGGNFSGGHNVRYLGSYNAATLEGGTGTSRFEGYFSDSNITSLKGQSEFSGVFEGSNSEILNLGNIKTGAYNALFDGFFKNMKISALEGENKFSGSFFFRTSIESGDGDDVYSGTFFDSSIKAGGGSNVFGKRVDLSKDIVAPDFIRTVIEAGDGEDKLFGFTEDSSINLGGGNDTVSGIMRDSFLETGDGDDNLTLLYAARSSIATGNGDDEVRLFSGDSNRVALGLGNNEMLSGFNAAGPVGQYGSIPNYSNIAFLTSMQARSGVDPRFGHHFGDVANTEIDASQGENDIKVHDGLNEHRVKSGIVEDKKSADTNKIFDKSNDADGSEAAKRVAGETTDPLLGSAAPAPSVQASTKAEQDLHTAFTELLRGGADLASAGNVSSPDSAESDSAGHELGGKSSKQAGVANARFLSVALGGTLAHSDGNYVTIKGAGDARVSFSRLARNFVEDTEDKRPLQKLLQKYRSFAGMSMGS